MKITLLPPQVIEKIAAGEVVERPSSVVKELVENSIDAKSTHIQIYIEQGGQKRIMVMDNGEGIDEKDMILAVTKHATSKITCVEDLHNLHTLGFRGEALASIAAVSKLSLESKTQTPTLGSKVFLQEQQWKQEPIGMSQGTRVVIDELFYNIPVRKKFMKSDQTEFGHILGIIMEYALIHPEIRFTIYHNQKEMADLLATTDIQKRVVDVFGKDYFHKLVTIDFEEDILKIHGFVSTPDMMPRHRGLQYLAVNGRAIRDGLFVKAVREGLGHILPHEKHPAFYLHLSIRPDLVDVNIHPRKTEIKFADQRMVFSFIQRAIWNAFNAKQYFTDPAGAFLFSGPKPIPRQPSSFTPTFTPQISQNSWAFKSLQVQQPTQQSFTSTPSLSFTLLGQVNKKYIAIEKEGKLILIDQHAAHEGLRYKLLLEESQKKEKRSQLLLQPLNLSLNLSEQTLFDEYKEAFLSLGFVFSGNAVLAVPTPLAGEPVLDMIKSTLQEISTHLDQTHLQEKTTRLLKYAACRKAIMFSHTLSTQEMMKLVQDVFDHHVLTCAHGRPISFEIDLHELEHKFHRH